MSSFEPHQFAIFKLYKSISGFPSMQQLKKRGILTQNN